VLSVGRGSIVTVLSVGKGIAVTVLSVGTSVLSVGRRVCKLLNLKTIWTGKALLKYITL
jgi:hypothetical protein